MTFYRMRNDLLLLLNKDGDEYKRVSIYKLYRCENKYTVENLVVILMKKKDNCHLRYIVDTRKC